MERRRAPRALSSLPALLLTACEPQTGLILGADPKPDVTSVARDAVEDTAHAADSSDVSDVIAPGDVTPTDVPVVDATPTDVPVVDATPSGNLGAVRRDGETLTLRTHPTVNYRGVDAAYDPMRRQFLVVYGNAPIGGALLDDEGRQVGDPFRLTSEPQADGRWTQLPRVAYGSDSFLVTWHAEVGRAVVPQARRVVLGPAGPSFTGPEAPLGEPGSQQESPVAVAFSPATGEFLVAWAHRGLKLRRVSASGAVLGAVVQASEEGVWVEQPSIAYHAGARCFFVVFMQEAAGARVVLQRVEDGTARPLGAARDLAGPLSFAKITDAAFDAHVGEVIATWYEVRGAERGFAAQRFRGDGEPAAPAQPVFRPHHSYDGYDLAWNAATGTAFAAFHGPAAEAFGAELGRSGASSTPFVATASGARNGLFLPRVTAHPERPWWLVFGSADYARVTVQRVVWER